MSRSNFCCLLWFIAVVSAIVLWWQVKGAMYYAIGLLVVSLVFMKFFFAGGVNKHYPDCSFQTVVITGANAGLGLISAIEIGKLNPKKLILACRNQKRGEEALRKVKEAWGGNVNAELMSLDLGDFHSIRKFAQDFNEKHDKLDILLNNAGIMALKDRKTTKQGLERQLGVNHFGHFYLTRLLLDKIKNSEQGRVVCLSSSAHQMTKGGRGMNFEDLHFEHDYNDWEVYGQSKYANLIFAKQLAIRMRNEGVNNVKTCSLHPGVVRTNLWDNFTGEMNCCVKLFWYVVYPFQWLFTKNPWQGTQTQLHCCLCPFEELQSGQYYSDCKVDTPKLTQDWQDQAEKLWEVSENECNKFENENPLNTDDMI